MKTFLPALGMLMALSSPLAQADVLGVTLGAEWWQVNPEGRMGDAGFSQRLSFDDDSHSAFYAAFEHPIPLLPDRVSQRSRHLRSFLQYLPDQNLSDFLTHIPANLGRDSYLLQLFLWGDSWERFYFENNY